MGLRRKPGSVVIQTHDVYMWSIYKKKEKQLNWIKTKLSFTNNRVSSQQHESIMVTKNHLRPNQRKLARHDQRNKQHSKGK